MSLTVDGVVDIEGYVDYSRNHLVTVTTGGVLEALFNDVRRKLVLKEKSKVSLDLLVQHGAIGIPSMLHNELNYVVAVAILYKGRAALAEFLQNDLLLLVGTVLEDALHHAAAVRVGGELLHGP